MFFEREIVDGSPYMGQIRGSNRYEFTLNKCCNIYKAVRQDTEAEHRGDAREMEFPGEGSFFQSLGRGSGTTGSVTMSVMMKKL
jgi:hypothetical protein